MKLRYSSKNDFSGCRHDPAPQDASSRSHNRARKFAGHRHAVGTGGQHRQHVTFGHRQAAIARRDNDLTKVVLSRSLRLAADAPLRLAEGDSFVMPAHTPYTLSEPTPDAQLLDVTLPADL